MALSLVLFACAPEQRAETRQLSSDKREASIKGSAGWSKWCGPLEQAKGLAPKGTPTDKATLGCPEALDKGALQAIYPEALWPTLKGPKESVEVLYEAALSLETSTSMDPQCCYSVKHALGPEPR